MKVATCYHEGCNRPPVKTLKVTGRLYVAYCEYHYRAALERKRVYEITQRLLRGDKGWGRKV